MRTFNIHEAKATFQNFIDKTVSVGQAFAVSRAGKSLVTVVRRGGEAENRHKAKLIREWPTLGACRFKVPMRC